MIEKTPERVVMMTHGFSNVEVQGSQPGKFNLKELFPFLKILQFKAAFEPVSRDRDFFVSNDIERSKRQAEEFDPENNPTGTNMQNVFGELWQALVESAKKLIKTAATAMDRAASEAEVGKQ